MKVIGLIGIGNAKNLGDALLGQCTRYLLEQEAEKKGLDVSFRVIELLPAELKKNKSGDVSDRRILGRIKAFVQRFSALNRRIERILYNKKTDLEKYTKYYRTALDGCDAIVFVGGGLIKFKQQETLNVSVAAAIRVAEEMGISAAFHACGVEGYDEKDGGCRRLKASLNSPCVKLISTRDDLDTLERYFEDVPMEKRPCLMRCADSAVIAGEMLGISGEAADKPRLIGIGVIRDTIFMNYGVPFSSDKLLKLYCDIIRVLEEKHYDWRLFCNGYQPDYNFAKKILKKVGRSEEEYLLEKPEAFETLVRQISGFRGVIAARLHACIISYSLAIPIMGLCWNDKLHFFGRLIHKPDNFLDPKDFKADWIVAMLEKDMAKGYDAEEVACYRDTARQSAARILEYV